MCSSLEKQNQQQHNNESSCAACMCIVGGKSPVEWIACQGSHSWRNLPFPFCQSSGANSSSAGLGLHVPPQKRNFCLAWSYAGLAHISYSHCEVMCTADHASSISLFFLASRLWDRELPCVLPAGIVIELGWFFTASSSLVSYSGIPNNTMLPPHKWLRQE